MTDTILVGIVFGYIAGAIAFLVLYWEMKDDPGFPAPIHIAFLMAPSLFIIVSSIMVLMEVLA